MSTAAQSPALSSRRARGVTLLIAVVALLTIMAVTSWWQYRSERDAISGLPDAERKAFYERTLHTLQKTCGEGRDGLDAYCETQAELIVQFPECDEACHKLALLHKARPTR